MALTDYTFKLGDDGIVLNAPTTDFPFVDIEEVRGLDSAPYRETTRDHEGFDGGFLDAEFEKARPIILEGTIYDDPDHLEIFLDDLKANYAPSTALIPFYLKAPNQVERVLFVKPQGVRYDWDTDRRLGITRAQFLVYAEDPRIYTNIENVVDIPLSGVSTEGFGFPLDFPFGFGTSTESSGAVSLINNGNRPTPVEFTIFGPVSTPRIINETLGKELRFNIDIGPTDTLVVNSYYRTVRVNGAVNRRSALLEPNWFDLSPGETVIRFQEGGGLTVFDENPLNANPWFETDDSNWSATGGTVVRSTVRSHEGVASLLLTPDGVSDTARVRSEYVPATPGALYKALAWVFCASARPINLQILWFDQSQVFISTSSFGFNLPATTWTFIEKSYLAPAGARFMRFQIDMWGTPSPSDTLNIDEAMLQGVKRAKAIARFRSAWR